MKAIFLIRYGKSENVFQIGDVSVPVPKDNEVLIKSEVFGLNFADVMARLGMYRDSPPIPCVLGYEVVGKVEAFGKNVTGFQKGQRVVAFTRFGAYAEYAVTDSRGVHQIPDEMDSGIASALATQYCTAWFCAEEMVKLNEGDHVLINAAAGGVGIALVQIAKRKKCIVYGTCGSDEKVAFLKNLGVDYPINYNKENFFKKIQNICGGERLDVVFDSVGGKNFSVGKKLLAHGGRIVGYGAAEQVHNGFFSTLKMVWNFGFLNPVVLLVKSQSIIGVNMLRIAESKPEALQRCLKNIVALAVKGDLKPHVGGTFSSDKIAEAHSFLESRKSIGKIVVKW